MLFKFDEPVTGTPHAVEVYGPSGDRVDQGGAFHPNGTGPVIGTHLAPNLPKAPTRRPTASSRPTDTSSRAAFSSRSASAAPRQARASRRSSVRRFTWERSRRLRSAWFARFSTRRLPPPEGSRFSSCSSGYPPLPRCPREERSREASEALVRRARTALVVAAVFGMASAWGGVILEGASEAGKTFFGALNSSVVSEVLTTRFGLVCAVGGAAWIVLRTGAIIGLSASKRRSSPFTRGAPCQASSSRAHPSATISQLASSFPLPPSFFLPHLPHPASTAGSDHQVDARLVSIPCDLSRMTSSRPPARAPATRLLSAPWPDPRHRARLGDRADASGLIQAYVYVRHPATFSARLRRRS